LIVVSVYMLLDMTGWQGDRPALSTQAGLAAAPRAARNFAGRLRQGAALLSLIIGTSAGSGIVATRAVGLFRTAIVTPLLRALGRLSPS